MNIKKWSSIHVPVYRDFGPLSCAVGGRLKYFSKEYYHCLNPIFSFQKFEKGQLKDFEYITLRDGAIPLIYFFANNITPINNNILLLVDVSLSSLVPKLWKKNILFYEIRNISRKSYITRNKLLISGIFYEDLMSKRFINSFLKRLSHITSNKKLEIELFLNIESITRFQEKYIYFINKLLEKCYRISRFWNEEDFSKIKHTPNCFEKYYFANFNNKLLIADDFVTHFVLNKNALLLPNKKKRGEAVIENLSLSNNHEMVLFDIQKTRKDFLIEDVISNLKLLEINDLNKGTKKTSFSWNYENFKYIYEQLEKCKVIV